MKSFTSPTCYRCTEFRMWQFCKRFQSHSLKIIIYERVFCCSGCTHGGRRIVGIEAKWHAIETYLRDAIGIACSREFRIDFSLVVRSLCECVAPVLCVTLFIIRHNMRVQFFRLNELSFLVVAIYCTRRPVRAHKCVCSGYAWTQIGCVCLCPLLRPKDEIEKSKRFAGRWTSNGQTHGIYVMGTHTSNVFQVFFSCLSFLWVLSVQK